MGSKMESKYIKFIIYLVVIVLINIVGLSLFFRWDLTDKKLYSISKASQKVVSTLSDPLTINVFFTKDLPAPYNNNERYLKDLLEEYAVYGNNYFNYRFYDVSPDTGSEDNDAAEKRNLASNYGISPVQIQAYENDEVKFKKAYMGLVIIHGDMIEKIPVISSIDGLEYKLTTDIQKLNNKTSALLGLKDKIKVKLYYSSSLNTIAPIIGVQDLPKIPETIKKVVEKLNAKNFDKFVYTHFDPSTDQSSADQAKADNIKNLQWRDIPQRNIKADSGYIGLVLDYGKKTKTLQLLKELHFLLGGTQYKLVALDDLEEIINDNVESLIDINENLGYLADYGTLKINQTPPMNPMQRQQADTLSNFNAAISQNYSLKDVKLKTGEIPSGLNCLIIARPTEKFSDYDLYQIDQMLMRGTNLAIFMDPFQEIQMKQQQYQFNQGPTYVPIHSGLEKLLKHYGVNISKSFVLDEKCYKQMARRQMGGGEQPIYFAPMIQNDNIASDLDFMKNIKQLITMKIAPLELETKTLKDNHITAHKLFSSSDESWEMSGRINLNPMFIRPPQKAEEKHRMPLAYLLEGEFPSYFAGKPIPAKPDNKSDKKSAKTAASNDKADHSAKTDSLLDNVKGQGGFIAQSKPSKIFVIGSSEMLQDNMFAQESQLARNPIIRNNVNFILNVIDDLNNRSDIAVMRSKEESFNPLNEKLSAELKGFIKIFNIAGLPLLTALFGCFIWILRRSKRKRIKMMFTK